MKRFLSIDWDFFINATSEQRCLMFPDGGSENIPGNLRDFIWDSCYRNPELQQIKTHSLGNLYTLCSKFKGPAVVCDSHKWMYNFVIANTRPKEHFEVYNLDFHHDLYDFPTKDGSVNCGNWATVLRKLRPNMKYVWVCRETSDVMSGENVVDAPTMSAGEFWNSINGNASAFDYLFLCRSGVWSPPHLDEYFVKTAKLLGYDTRYEKGILTPRPYEIPESIEELVSLLHPKGMRSKPRENKEVIDFIRLFSNGNDEMSEKFTRGLCYWFAFILHERFSNTSTLMYDPVENHFMVRIYKELYDIRGRVSDLYPDAIEWDSFSDEKERCRIIRDCILKLNGM